LQHTGNTGPAGNSTGPTGSTGPGPYTSGLATFTGVTGGYGLLYSQQLPVPNTQAVWGVEYIGPGVSGQSFELLEIYYTQNFNDSGYWGLNTTLSTSLTTLTYSIRYHYQ
jgi:hypothetical protein